MGGTFCFHCAHQYSHIGKGTGEPMQCCLNVVAATLSTVLGVLGIRVVFSQCLTDLYIVFNGWNGHDYQREEMQFLSLTSQLGEIFNHYVKTESEAQENSDEVRQYTPFLEFGTTLSTIGKYY